MIDADADARIAALLEDVAIPRGVRVERSIVTEPALDDVGARVREALRAVSLPRGSVAIGVGSRGIARIVEIVRALVAALRDAGAEPFIVPAMGSHGASSAEGQVAVLARLGIDEASVGAPVRATMEAVEIGRTSAGIAAYMDAYAYAADAAIVVNRVKPHTAFRGPIESGPTKMLAIGFGKQRGAHAAHAGGWGSMHATIPAVAACSIGTGKIAFALAIVENADEAPCAIEAIPATELLAREPALLERASANLARLPFDALDVLVVDRIGKNVSGDGADPNVTGRFPTAYGGSGIAVTRLVFCDLTDETAGNANGVGLADVITRTLARKFDPAATYPNALTSTTPETTRLPMTLATPRLALAAALVMCAGVEPSSARVCRIHDTLRLHELWVSEALLPSVHADATMRVVDEPSSFPLPA